MAFSTSVVFCVLSFPGASNSTLLSKFSHNHRDNPYFQVPQLKEEAFIITHYAGKVKYMIKVSSIYSFFIIVGGLSPKTYNVHVFFQKFLKESIR